jgi:hypothetical protein
MFELDGERVQAGYFREIITPNGQIADHTREAESLGIMLGDPITIYFQGPKKKTIVIIDNRCSKSDPS